MLNIVFKKSLAIVIIALFVGPGVTSALCLD
jgi:hypothetical protein